MKEEMKEAKAAFTEGNIEGIIFTGRDREKVFRQIQMKKKTYKKQWILGVAFTMITCFTLYATAPLIPNSYAHTLSSIPGIGSIFKLMGDKGLQDSKEIVQDVNMIDMKNGSMMEIQEAIFDGERISLSYSLETETEIKDYNLDYFDIHSSAHSAGFASYHDFKQIAPNRIVGIATISFNKGDLPDKLNTYLNYHVRINGQRTKFSFEFPVVLSGETKKLSPNVTKKNHDQKLTVKELTMTPLTTVFNLSMEKPTESGMFNSFRLFDQNGKEIKQLFSSETTGENIYEAGRISMPAIPISFEKLDEDVTSLTIQPIERTNQDGRVSSHQEKLDTLPLDLNLGEMGNLIIESVTRNTSSTIVKYTIESPFFYEYANHFEISDQNGVIHYGNRKSEHFIGNQAWVVEQEFFDLPNGKLLINYEKAKTPKILKELEITVPIK